jgi:hypothetical protein
MGRWDGIPRTATASASAGACVALWVHTRAREVALALRQMGRESETITQRDIPWFTERNHMSGLPRIAERK